jgi:hypothetical protein
MAKVQARLVMLLVCLGLLGGDGSGQETQRHLVLVCSTESSIPSLSQQEVRKLFLGVPTVRNGIRLKPLRNETEPRVSEVFLQKVIFMSQRSYERQLVSRVFRLGGTRPPVFTEMGELLDELRQSPGALSYMWSDQVAQTYGVKSCGVLW